MQLLGVYRHLKMSLLRTREKIHGIVLSGYSAKTDCAIIEQHNAILVNEVLRTFRYDTCMLYIGYIYIIIEARKAMFVSTSVCIPIYQFHL